MDGEGEVPPNQRQYDVVLAPGMRLPHPHPYYQALAPDYKRGDGRSVHEDGWSHEYRCQGWKLHVHEIGIVWGVHLAFRPRSNASNHRWQ